MKRAILLMQNGDMVDVHLQPKLKWFRPPYKGILKYAWKVANATRYTNIHPATVTSPKNGKGEVEITFRAIPYKSSTVEKCADKLLECIQNLLQ